jgi:hypothetical protein
MAAVRLVPVETSCWIFCGGVGIQRIAGGAAHGVQRLDQRHTGRKHGGKRACPAGNAGFFDQGAKHGYFEHYPVHDFLHFLVALPGLEEKVKSAADAAENQPPISHEKFADRNDNQGGAGKSAPNDENTVLNAGITKIMITATTTKATTTTEMGTSRPT